MCATVMACDRGGGYMRHDMYDEICEEGRTMHMQIICSCLEIDSCGTFGNVKSSRHRSTDINRSRTLESMIPYYEMKDQML